MLGAHTLVTSHASASRQVDASFAERVITWQRSHGRHGLPWQRTRDPYRVWLSEVMLQQTQVTTVLGYYARFLDRFPTVAALAAAAQDDVLAEWSGLGYYSRARYLHRCAQVVVAEHGGSFPKTSDALMALPGIGRSTAAAIAAFCFGERVAILDGNVKRVIARVLAFEGDLADAAPLNELWGRATALLPEGEGIESYTQGLMDLGATVCTTRAPACLLCPLQSVCAAARTGTPTYYPIKSKRLKRSRREHVWLWLEWRDKTWLVQRPQQGVWAGLWSLPEFNDMGAFDDAAEGWPGRGESLPSFTHTLTHLDWTLHPLRWTFPARTTPTASAALVASWPGGKWVTLPAALSSALPAPLRVLLTTHWRATS